MRFSDLLDRTETKKLTQAAASELLGISVRTFQRWAERYEAEGAMMGRSTCVWAGDRRGGRKCSMSGASSSHRSEPGLPVHALFGVVLGSAVILNERLEP